MKKIIEILIFALALAAFVSCEKEPDPIPEEPMTLPEFLIGSWKEIPSNPTELAFYSLVFGGSYYTVSFTDETGRVVHGDAAEYSVTDSEVVMTQTWIRDYVENNVRRWPMTPSFIVIWSEHKPDEMTLVDFGGTKYLYNRLN